jgi:hypothetical protein
VSPITCIATACCRGGKGAPAITPDDAAAFLIAVTATGDFAAHTPFAVNVYGQPPACGLHLRGPKHGGEGLAPNGAVEVTSSDKEATASCLWCGRSVEPRTDGGRPRRFCLPQHRMAYYSAARRFVDQAVRQGRLSVAELHAPQSTCTLIPVAISGVPATGVAKTDRNAPSAKIRVLWAELPPKRDEPMVKRVA